MKKSEFATRLATGLVVAALLAAPVSASAAPRHAPPPGHRHAPAHFEHCGPAVPPPHGAFRHHAPPPPPPPPPRHHAPHRDYYCDDTDIATDAAVAVGTLALIGIVAALCAD